jgi:curved DNA-binding protein CbpA
VAAGPDHNKILQVDSEAEDEVIQAAYRRLAQKYHPDRYRDADGAARMVAINAAWEVLRDPGRRATYDAARAAAARSGSAAPPGPTVARSPAAATTPPTAAPPGASPNRPPDSVSRDWTSGRSAAGGGYDASTMRKTEGEGAAGPPSGRPSGSVLKVGRYAGWSIGEIGRTDLDYLEWLDRMAIGRQYRDEIDQVLRRAGRRRSAPAADTERRGLFRR